MLGQNLRQGCWPSTNKAVWFRDPGVTRGARELRWYGETCRCGLMASVSAGGGSVLSAAFLKAAAAAAGVKPHGAHGVRHVACKMQREVHVWDSIAVLRPTLPCGNRLSTISRVSV